MSNPRRLGACAECGAYRNDGRFPYLHPLSCSRHGDLQLDRWLAEQAAGDHGGPVLYETDADVALALQLGVRDAVTYAQMGVP